MVLLKVFLLISKKMKLRTRFCLVMMHIDLACVVCLSNT